MRSKARAVPWLLEPRSCDLAEFNDDLHKLARQEVLFGDPDLGPRVRKDLSNASTG